MKARTSWLEDQLEFRLSISENLLEKQATSKRLFAILDAASTIRPETVYVGKKQFPFDEVSYEKAIAKGKGQETHYATMARSTPPESDLIELSFVPEDGRGTRFLAEYHLAPFAGNPGRKTATQAIELVRAFARVATPIYGLSTAMPTVSSAPIPIFATKKI